MAVSFLFLLIIGFTLAAVAALVIVAVAVILAKPGKSRFPWSLVIFTVVLAALMTGVGLITWKHVHGRRDQVARHSQLTEFDLTDVDYEHYEQVVWRPGVQDQFQADVYPSKKAAHRALGLRVADSMHDLLGPAAIPEKIIVFKADHQGEMLTEFTNAVSESLPAVPVFTERESAAVEPNQIGIRIDLEQTADDEKKLRAVLLTADGKEASTQVTFVEKDWVHGAPDDNFLVARSMASSTTRAGANRQAMTDAAVQLSSLLNAARQDRRPRVFDYHVSEADIVNLNMIADTFTQSFEGKATRIWRQALLIDKSPEKFQQLIARKTAAVKTAKSTWARLILTILGLLTLIIGVFAFLNAVTKGYYVWALRIAAAAIALFAVASAILLLGN